MIRRILNRRIAKALKKAWNSYELNAQTFNVNGLIIKDSDGNEIFYPKDNVDKICKNINKLYKILNK